MLFLSQVLGEEEDVERREQLVDVLTRAVVFTGQAQTAAGGWGYVSAKDGGDFDEGSTTITQVQGLRGCRNAGIPVPKEIIDKAINYIHKCTGPRRRRAVQPDHGGGGRPPITPPPSPACSTPATTTTSTSPASGLLPPRTRRHSNQDNSGHWHYAHYYYSQVLYREGGKTWEDYRDKICRRPRCGEQNQDGYWDQGYMGAGLHDGHESDHPATANGASCPSTNVKRGKTSFPNAKALGEQLLTQRQRQRFEHARHGGGSRNSATPGKRSSTNWPRSSSARTTSSKSC